MTSLKLYLSFEQWDRGTFLFRAFHPAVRLGVSPQILFELTDQEKRQIVRQRSVPDRYSS